MVVSLKCSNCPTCYRDFPLLSPLQKRIRRAADLWSMNRAFTQNPLDLDGIDPATFSFGELANINETNSSEDEETDAQFATRFAAHSASATGISDCVKTMCTSTLPWRRAELTNLFRKLDAYRSNKYALTNQKKSCELNRSIDRISQRTNLKGVLLLRPPAVTLGVTRPDWQEKMEVAFDWDQIQDAANEPSRSRGKRLRQSSKVN